MLARELADVIAEAWTRPRWVPWMNQIGRNVPVRRPSSTIWFTMAIIGVTPTPPETKTTGR
jgi:hypothetical protein